MTSPYQPTEYDLELANRIRHLTNELELAIKESKERGWDISFEVDYTFPGYPVIKRPLKVSIKRDMRI